jgi:hypothetical protein
MHGISEKCIQNFWLDLKGRDGLIWEDTIKKGVIERECKD